MSNDYIAVFDSGIGGLTVVKALKELLPQENIIYFGDTFNMPYGEKTISQIKQFSIDNIDFLSFFKPKAYVVACGTMSGNAMDEMIKLTDKPVIGVIKPACKKAVSITKNNKIGILATPAAIKANAYANTIKEINEDIDIISVGCEGLAKQIELGKFDSQDTIDLLNKYLQPLKDNNVDTIVLGCTHYPLVSSLVQKLMPSCNIVSCSFEQAIYVKDYLEANALLSNNHIDDKYFVSGDIDSFIKSAKQFIDIDEVNLK